MDINTIFSDVQKVLGEKQSFILNIEVVTKQVYRNSHVHYILYHVCQGGP